MSRLMLLITHYSSLSVSEVEQHPLTVLFHVDARLANRKLAREGGVRFQKALNGGVITRRHAPLAVLAYQILLHYYLALSFDSFGESSINFRIRDSQFAQASNSSNINTIKNERILSSLQSTREPI